jgi:DNA transformation protein
MAAGVEYLQYILEQLARLPDVSSRRMFGAFGLYCGDQFFALISEDTLYFKVGDATRANYESRGMARFRPYPDKPLLSMSYYEVPADVLEDGEALVTWARKAVDAALKSEAEKKPAKTKSKAKAKAKPKPKPKPKKRRPSHR